MKNEKDSWDDGRVIAPMDVDGMPPSRRINRGTKGKTLDNGLTRKEKRAMVRAMFSAMLPRILIISVSFVIVFLFLYLWLKNN